MSGIFKGSANRNHAVMMLDGEVDITIAAGEHPYSADDLYLMGVIAGDKVFVPEQTRRHGLNPLQVGISSTLYGQTWRLEPQAAARKMNSRGEVVIDPSAYEAYKVYLSQGRLEEAEQLFLRVPLEGETEVREAIAAELMGEGDGDLEGIAAEIPVSVVNQFPYQGRRSILLNRRLEEGEFSSSGVGVDELSAIMDAVRSQREGSLEGAAHLMEMLGLDPEQTEDAELRARLGGELASLLKGGGEPQLAPNWGFPELLYMAYEEGEAAFEAVQEVQGWTATALVSFSAERDGGIKQSYFRDEKVTFDDVTSAIAAIDQAYSEAFEAWEGQADASRFWMNLGEIIDGIEEGNGFDARPRQGMSEAPVADSAIGDFEAEAIRRSLLRSATPRDEMRLRGDLNQPLSEMVPYVQDDDGGVNGHPMAWAISSMLQMAQRDQDPSEILDNDGEFAIQYRWNYERVLMEPESVVGYDTMEHDGTELKVPVIEFCGQPALVLDADAENGTHLILVSSEEEHPEYVYEVGEKDVHILGSVADCGTAYEVGDKVRFKSLIGMQAWLHQFRTVVCIAERDGSAILERNNSLKVDARPASDVFPVLCEFFGWMADEWEGGGEHEVGVHSGIFEEWMEKVNQELSAYQRRQLELVVDANLGHFDDVIAVVEDSYQAMGENLTTQAARRLSGTLQSMAWAAVSRIDEETLVCPRPMRKVLGEWEVNLPKMWRILGYQPTDGFRNLKTLKAMVTERIMRVHPMDMAKRRVWETDSQGRTSSKTVFRKAVQWTSDSDYGLGLIGDEIAKVKAKAVGLSLPCMKKDLYSLSEKEVLEFFQDREVWGTGTGRRVLRAKKSCLGRKSMTANDLVWVIFPLPLAPSQDASAEEQEEFAQALQAQSRRQLMFMSPAWEMTAELFDMACEGHADTSRIVQGMTKTIGSEVAKAILELVV